MKGFILPCCRFCDASARTLGTHFGEPRGPRPGGDLHGVVDVPPKWTYWLLLHAFAFLPICYLVAENVWGDELVGCLVPLETFSRDSAKQC